MKRRYWLPAAFLIAVGAALYFCTAFYSFSGLLCCALGAAVLVFGGVDRLKVRFPRVLCPVQWVLRGLALLVLLAALGTAVWVGDVSRGADDPAAEFVIVLGAGVNGTEPSQSLHERLCAARDYLNAYPDAVAVLSGGQGNGEDITEAECMYRWLVAAGISPDRLREEERATSTAENLSFSAALLEDEFGTRPETVAVVSNEYHLLRASLLARNESLRTLGVPARTYNRFYFAQMLLREICGVWYTLLFS